MSFLIFLKLLPFPLYYLIGSFPTGYLLARARGVDIKKQGSGNVGATNVARVMGKKAGIITLLVDICKGYFAVSLASFISAGNLDYMALAGLVCIMGHCFSLPPYLSGGKGIATSCGVLLALQLALGFISLGGFIVGVAVTRIVSIGSIVAAITASVTALMLGFPTTAWYSVAGMTLVVIYRHRENMERLAHGTEKKFSLQRS